MNPLHVFLVFLIGNLTSIGLAICYYWIAGSLASA